MIHVPTKKFERVQKVMTSQHKNFVASQLMYKLIYWFQRKRLPSKTVSIKNSSTH